MKIGNNLLKNKRNKGKTKMMMKTKRVNKRKIKTHKKRKKTKNELNVFNFIQ